MRGKGWCRGPGYFEVDVDVGSSSVAATVVGMVLGTTKSLVVDLGIVLEGHSSDELPEALLGTVRFDHVDMGSGKYLDVETGELHPTQYRLQRLREAKSKRSGLPAGLPIPPSA